jgi:hypothetical protein
MAESIREQFAGEPPVTNTQPYEAGAEHLEGAAAPHRSPLRTAAPVLVAVLVAVLAALLWRRWRSGD